MSAQSHNQDPVIESVIRGAGHDEVHHEPGHEQPHDQATEVAHAWDHFHENWKFFLCFFGVVLLTVITFNINFGPTGNKIAIGVTAVMRCALIAYFMGTLFKSFTFVTRTFVFCAIFLAGMVFLSWWDSEIPGIGNPIYNSKDPASMKP